MPAVLCLVAGVPATDRERQPCSSRCDAENSGLRVVDLIIGAVALRRSGDYDGHIVNEFKLMVLCSEFLEVRIMLEELEFSE